MCLWKESFELLSKNPVLKNITTYLIEEASAEEEELLGQNESIEETDEKDSLVFNVNIYEILKTVILLKINFI